jgi:c-di-AMP phosphodiesterase-like protein
VAYTQIPYKAGDSRFDFIKRVFIFIFATLLIVLILGVYINNTFDWYVSLLYWLMIFGLLVTSFIYLVLPKLKGNKPQKAKILKD